MGPVRSACTGLVLLFLGAAAKLEERRCCMHSRGSWSSGGRPGLGPFHLGSMSSGHACFRQQFGGVIKQLLKHVPGPGSLGAGRQLARTSAAAASSSGSGGAGHEAWLTAVKAARILLGVTAVAGISLASLPALLSTPGGLRLALNILNYHQPGTVDVQSCSLALTGLTRGSVTLEGVTLHEPVNLGGHRLLAAKQVVCSGSLFELYTGSPSHVVMHDATINGAYCASAADFRLIRYLQVAGVISPPPPSGPPGQHQEEGAVRRVEERQKGQQRALEQGTGASSSGGSSGVERDHRSKQTGSQHEPEQAGAGGQGSGPSQPAAPATQPHAQQRGAQLGFLEQGAVKAGEMAVAVEQAGVDASGVVQREAAKASEAAGAMAQSTRDALQDGVDAARSLGLPPSVLRRREMRQKRDLLQAGQEEEDRLVAEQGRFMETLTTASSSMALQGEMRTPTFTLQVTGASSLQVHPDLRDIMGGRINMYAAFGEGPLQWLHERHAQEVNYVVNSNGDTGAAKQPQDAGQHWWQGPPPHPLAAKLLQQALSERGPQRVSPGEWQVTAPNMHLSMRVWEVDSQGGGRPEDSFTLLHQPASLTLRFTQALSRFALSTLNPLLGQVSELAEGSRGALRTTFAPDGMALPYTSASVHVEPMRLRLAAAPLVAELVTGLHIPGLNLQQKPHVGPGQRVLGWLMPWRRHNHHHRHHNEQNREEPEGSSIAGRDVQQVQDQDQVSGSQPHRQQSAQHSKRGVHESSDDEGGKRPLLEAWVSAQHIRLERGGLLGQRRVDMLIGADLDRPGSGVHLVLWGTVDPDTDEISMTVGIPAPTLARFGIKDLPPNYCLPLELAGTIDAPSLKLGGVTGRVAQLLLREAARAKRQRQAGRMEAARANAVKPEEEEEQRRHKAGEGQEEQRLGEGPAGMDESGEEGASRAVTEAPAVEDSPGTVGEGAGADEPDEPEELEDGGKDSRPEGHPHAGPKERLKRLGARVVSLALDVVDPAAHSLAAIEAQVARDAARVPAQEQPLPPWVKGDRQAAA